MANEVRGGRPRGAAGRSFAAKVWDRCHLGSHSQPVAESMSETVEKSASGRGCEKTRPHCSHAERRPLRSVQDRRPKARWWCRAARKATAREVFTQLRPIAAIRGPA